MGRSLVVASCVWFAVILPSAARAQQQDPAGAPSEAAQVLQSIQWTAGPAKVAVGHEAEIDVPAGLRYTAAEGTRKLLELMQNPTDGSELGMLTSDELDWFVTFEFSDIGYVKDADKEKLDAEEILASIRKGNDSANEARRERGWPSIQIVGWHTAPFYNKATNNLEWCIKGESEGRPIINYNTRILGRGGVMSANLMVSPDALEATLPTIKKLLAGFAFIPGKRYAEWRSGDKIAKYGLTALVVGGAVGVAAKVGLLAKLGKLWKPIVIGLFGVLAALRKLLTRRRDTPPVDQTPPAPPPAPPQT